MNILRSNQYKCSIKFVKILTWRSNTFFERFFEGVYSSVNNWRNCSKMVSFGVRNVVYELLRIIREQQCESSLIYYQRCSLFADEFAVTYLLKCPHWLAIMFHEQFANKQYGCGMTHALWHAHEAPPVVCEKRNTLAIWYDIWLYRFSIIKKFLRRNTLAMWCNVSRCWLYRFSIMKKFYKVFRRRILWDYFDTMIIIDWSKF